MMVIAVVMVGAQMAVDLVVVIVNESRLILHP